MPRTDIKLYLNLTKLDTIVKQTLLISITNPCIQISNSQTSIITLCSFASVVVIAGGVVLCKIAPPLSIIAKIIYFF